MLFPLTIVTTSLLWTYRRKLSMGAGYARLAWRRWRRSARLETTIVADTPPAIQFNVSGAALPTLEEDMELSDMDLDIDSDIDSDEEDEAAPPASPG